MLILAIATSIDALAIGITFAFLEVNITLAVSLIGIITFIIPFAFTGYFPSAYFLGRESFFSGILLNFVTGSETGLPFNIASEFLLSS